MTSPFLSTPAFTAVARADEIAEGKVKILSVGGRSILLVRSEGQLFAIENRCSHADQPLDCGRVKRGWIACPAHGARFDLKSGEPLGPPANVPIATFALRISGGIIEIAV